MKEFGKNLFGIRLKELREEANINQEKLAEILNTYRANINRYEKRTREPDYDTLVKIADFFDVSADYLLGRTDNRRKL
jgi:transcriptional regulator with XRE-family HTH domain